MAESAGYWAVVETGQGGGIPDNLHGPYWSEEEAGEQRDHMVRRAERVGRRDRFQVAHLDTSADED